MTRFSTAMKTRWSFGVLAAVILVVGTVIMAFLERDFIAWRMYGCRCFSVALPNGEARIFCVDHPAYPRTFPLRQVTMWLWPDIPPATPPPYDGAKKLKFGDHPNDNRTPLRGDAFTTSPLAHKP